MMNSPGKYDLQMRRMSTISNAAMQDSSLILDGKLPLQTVSK